MRHVILLLLLLVALVFGYTVLSRLASESRALLTGVVIGLVAGAPAALIAAVIAGRAAVRPPPALPQPAPQHIQPQVPVLIVNPGQTTRSTRYAPFVDALLGNPPARTFTIIGDEDNDNPPQT